jgi:exonuclease SbcC
LGVGIISHVEEIKNRVPVKLIVYPAVQGVGGTRVEIEYS